VISLAEPSLFSAVRFILLPSADSSAQAPYFVSARAGAPVPARFSLQRFLVPFGVAAVLPAIDFIGSGFSSALIPNQFSVL
jgi:hypothetical protein